MRGILGADEASVKSIRLEHGIKSAYKRIDTCAAEFESFTPYMYGTYEDECEAEPTPRQKVVILGSGPNRIGQGLEFDYCCCHARLRAARRGVRDHDDQLQPGDRARPTMTPSTGLYFEPLTFEDVSSIIEREREAGGDVACVVQYGGRRR